MNNPLFIIDIIKVLANKVGFEIRRTRTLPANASFMKQFLYFDRMYKKISGVEGDIVECGVGKGRTFLALAFLASQEGKGRKLWGFDSFEGFPEPSQEDISFRNPKRGDWSGYEITIKHIYSILNGASINKDFVRNNIKIVKGFFNQTLPSFGAPIAFLHIDADLYDSYKNVLKILFPKVVKGGIVLFDEYKTDKWPGATKAVDEFFADKPYKIQKDERASKYFLVKI